MVMDGLLTEERLRFLIDLVADIAQQGKAFNVFPPAEVTNEPAVLDRDDAAAKLIATKWWLRFSDGAEHLLTFPELMIITHNLIALMTKPSAGFTISIPNLMNPETVRFLLGKLDLEGVPRDKYVPTFPLYGVHKGEAGTNLQLQGCSDPNTGLDLIFVFSDPALADRLAGQIADGSSILLAESFGELKTLLQSTGAQAVAFDPVLMAGRFQARHTVLVPAILAM
jgi:hypothetical protein